MLEFRALLCTNRRGKESHFDVCWRFRMLGVSCLSLGSHTKRIPLLGFCCRGLLVVETPRCLESNLVERLGIDALKVSWGCFFRALLGPQEGPLP